MTDVDRLDLLAQELGFVLKWQQRETLELLLRGKDFFCVLPTGFCKSLIYSVSDVCSCKEFFKFFCNERQSLLSRLCKTGGSVDSTRLLPHAKMLLLPMNLFSLLGRLCFGGKRFDLANVNFGGLLKCNSYWEVVTRMLIFSGRHDFALWCKSIFFFGLFRNVKFFIAAD